MRNSVVSFVTKNIQNKGENGLFSKWRPPWTGSKIKIDSTQNGSEANGKLYETINTVKMYTDNLILLSRIENVIK